MSICEVTFFRKPVEHFLKAVDSITLDDISKFSQKIISSPLTMASYGDGNLGLNNNLIEALGLVTDNAVAMCLSCSYECPQL